MNSAFRSYAGTLLVLAAIFTAGHVTPAAAQTRTSFRLNQLTINDPRIFLNELGGCGNPQNGVLNLAINSQYINVCNPPSTDPCSFDLNLVAVFDPLVQTQPNGPTTDIVQCMSAGQPCELDFTAISECTRTGGTNGTIACNGEPSFVFPTTYSTGGFAGGVGAACLGALAGTNGLNNSGVPIAGLTLPNPAATATNNCFVTGEIDLNLEVGDGLINIPLKGARLAATYSGGPPATSLLNGMARGFLSEADADALMLDISLTTPALEIHAPLSYLLAGGATNCKVGQDDRDYNPPGDTVNGVRGWWFYLGYRAAVVTVPEFPTPTATATIGAGDTPTATPAPTNTQVPTATVTNTPLPTATQVATFTPTSIPPTATPVPITPTQTPTQGQVSCPGDCNGNNAVPISEVQLAVNIFLETAPVTVCLAADRNNNGEVAINELVLASLSFQNDCP